MVDMTENRPQLTVDLVCRGLHPFLDEEGVLHVGGQLEKAPYSTDLCHPIILPGSSPFVEMYLQFLHNQYYHAGCSFLIAFVASKYHIIGLYRDVKQVLKKCTWCGTTNPESSI